MAGGDDYKTVEAAVRGALHLPADAELDPRHRSRMRQRVVAMAPRAPRVSDRAVAAAGWLGLPGPWLLRALGIATVCAGLLASVAVASADSLPDEPLYIAKVATEQLRLIIAVTPEDRAAVELSIAEHRLEEAERLAVTAGASSTLLATGAYAAHVASAAAALAETEVAEPARAALVAQVQARVEEQRARAAVTAERLAADPLTAPAAAALETIARTPQATHRNIPARIAETAAAVGKRIAAVAVEAEERAKKERRPEAARGPGPRETSERTKESAKKAEESKERAKRAADKTPSGGGGRDREGKGDREREGGKRDRD